MGEPVAGGLDLERERRELRTEAVVQVAPQASPLLLARRDQPLARTLQVGGQAHGMGRDAGLVGEVVEQAPVRRA